jgi:hypothetical protein
MIENEIKIWCNNIKFTLIESYLIIDYYEMHIRIKKLEIKNIIIDEKNNVLNKIFISIRGWTKMEFIFFWEELNNNSIFDFFNEFI